MKLLHVDHVGVNLENLEAAKAFFIGLGFTVMGETVIQGELVDRVTGLKDVKDDIVMLQAPDGQFNLELVRFHHPLDEAGIQPAKANTLGMRHLCFAVEGLDEIVADLRNKGYSLVGEVQTYQDVYKVCYVDGPEGIMVELAEAL